MHSVHIEESLPVDARKPLRDTIRDQARSRWSTRGADPNYMQKIRPVVDFMLDRHFRVETSGWERLPEGPCLLVGIHSGTWLTMDAWTLVLDWWRHFGRARPLNGTAHDALMAMPGLGDFFRKVGVVPASRVSVTAALDVGHDVVVWPGGEVDAMRTWKQRHDVLFAKRRG